MAVVEDELIKGSTIMLADGATVQDVMDIEKSLPPKVLTYVNGSRVILGVSRQTYPDVAFDKDDVIMALDGAFERDVEEAMAHGLRVGMGLHALQGTFDGDAFDNSLAPEFVKRVGPWAIMRTSQRLHDAYVRSVKHRFGHLGEKDHKPTLPSMNITVEGKTLLLGGRVYNNVGHRGRDHFRWFATDKWNLYYNAHDVLKVYLTSLKMMSYDWHTLVRISEGADEEGVTQSECNSPARKRARLDML
jgi:hypothetical protein